MKALRSLLVMLAALLACAGAHAALACSMTISPVPFTGIYSSTANLNALGRLDVNCTRDPASDARKPTLWIGIAQGPTGNTMTRDTGGSTLSYTVSRKTYGAASLWTNSGGLGPTQNGPGALSDTIDFGAGGSATYSGAYDVYFQIPLGQLLAGAGVYLDPAVAVTMRSNDQNGAVLATATLGARISIPKSCRFSTDPSPVNVVYPAFSASAVTGVSNFELTCTEGTGYTLALDRTRSVIPTIELAYTLTLSATSNVGSAIAQPYTVNIDVPAGQAGRCTAGACNGTDTRTITITY